MSGYQVILTPEAQSDLRSIESSVRARLLDKLEWIGENAELVHHQALQGDEWKGCFKYRIGDSDYLQDGTFCRQSDRLESGTSARSIQISSAARK